MKRVVQHVLPNSIGVRNFCPINHEQTPVSPEEYQSVQIGYQITQQISHKIKWDLICSLFQDTSSQCNCTKFSLTAFHSVGVVFNSLVAMIDNQISNSNNNQLVTINDVLTCLTGKGKLILSKSTLLQKIQSLIQIYFTKNKFKCQLNMNANYHH